MGDKPILFSAPMAESFPTVAISINHVRQSDRYGCSCACLAMVLGLSYGEVRQMLGDLSAHGRSHHVWEEVLCRNFISIQGYFKFDPLKNKPRDVWPMPLWADVHICSVDAGLGEGTHCVVVFRNGVVFDPLKDSPTKWEDYSGVSRMVGLFDVRKGNIDE